MDLSSVVYGGIYLSIASNRITLREAHTNDSDYDNFTLPVPNATGSPTSYNILTDKSPVTIQQGGLGTTTQDGMRHVVFGNTTTSGITTYPTTTGLFRLTGTLPAGMPSGANGYGVLAIFGAGGYFMHLYVDATQNLYYAEASSSGAPSTWRKLTGTTVNPAT